ncbi:AI-2E family transporter [Ruminococcaceae bacterium OttesenSCG-928-I18]|nr:AI-2E family transporter [Ruminococcaceae bacterium OttesenSCG-928-I18]
MQLDKGTLKKLALLVGGAILLFWLLENFSLVGSVLALLWSLVFPFVLGFIIAFLLNLPMRAIETRLFKNRLPRLRRLLSFLITLVLVLAIISLVVFLVVPQLIDTIGMLVQDMPQYIERIQHNLQPLEQYIPALQEFLEGLHLDWANIGKTVFSWVQSGAGSFFSSAVGVATSFISGATSFVIALIFACYVLFDKEHMGAQVDALLKAYLSEKRYNQFTGFARLSNQIFSRFVTGQCTEAVAIGFVYIVVLAVGGFEYALLIGVLIGFTALIPILGAFIGCIVGALLILVSMGFWRGLAFVILFLVIQQLDGNFMYPRIVGTSIGLPAMWVLVAVAVGGGLMGIFGMLFFIPLTSVFYVLLRKDALNRLQAKGIDSPMEEYYKNKPKKPEKKRKKKREK